MKTQSISSAHSKGKISQSISIYVFAQGEKTTQSSIKELGFLSEFVQLSGFY